MKTESGVRPGKTSGTKAETGVPGAGGVDWGEGDGVAGCARTSAAADSGVGGGGAGAAERGDSGGAAAGTADAAEGTG